MRPSLLAAVALALLLGCAPDRNTPIGDIAKLTKLDDVMDNQKTSADPQFAKIGAATFTDADFAAFGQTSDRIQATSLKAKEFANGRAEFEALAMKLNTKAKALGVAAAAKDAAGANGALTEMKAACKECHSKFR
jgi:cytochrome c556